MHNAERKMEREIRELKEEMKEWKVKMKLERGKREAADRKILDLEGDMEVLKEKLKDERRERERMQRIVTEIRDGMKKAEEKTRREREGREKGEEIKKLKSEVRVIRDIKRKAKEGGRSKVWERGFILHKGEKWDESKDLQEWLEEFLEGTAWEVEETNNDETKKIIFATIEQMEEKWRKRREVNEGGEIRIEQWMSVEERRAKREVLLERERRLREGRKKNGEERGDSSIKVKVDGTEYVWWEEEGRIRKVKEEGERDEEEERRVRRKKED